MKKIIFINLLFVAFSFGFGQSDVKITKYKTSVIASFGGLIYSGDVCKDCINLGYSSSLSSRFQIAGRMFFRPEFTYMRIQAANDKVSELSFKNNTVTAFLNIEYALIHDRRRTDGRSKNEFFLGLSPILMHHKPFTTIDGRKVSLPALATENKGYSKFIPGLKLGFSADFSLKKERKIGIYADYCFLFSDYIDDVSGNYIDYSKQDKIKSLAIDPTQKAKIGDPRGNKNPFDQLIRLGIFYELSVLKTVKTFD